MMAITTTPNAKPGEARFRLRAYVCAAGDVRMPRDSEGVTMTFEQIYVTRPVNCRYAIAGWWAIDRYAYRFVTFDLFGVLIDQLNGKALTPKPRLEHDDFDALVMATVLLYDSG